MKAPQVREQHFRFPEFDDSLDRYRKRGCDFNAEALRRIVDFSQPDKFAMYVGIMAKVPGMDKSLYIDASREQQRELHIKQISGLSKLISLTPEEDDAHPENYYALAKALITFDLALETRLTVHTCLYYDTVRELGSAKHYKYVQRAYAMQDFGCFALTELGHGSNANGIQTVAEYDHATRSFVIDTPNPLAAKFWIGAAGKTANMAAILAHLVIGGNDCGLHGFLVGIRDYKTHRPIPGVVLGDCGPKAGLDGIDNGFIIFKKYRVSYDALLDKFSQITPEGKFKSSIKSKTKRFATMLSGLLRGRSGVFMASAAALRNALTIAIRFSAVRKQFALSEGGEVPILDYQMHRYRLMPHLANFFAVQLGCEQFIADLKHSRDVFRHDPEHNSKEEIHALASVTKVLSSIYGVAGLQECREACGGMGFSAFSTIGAMKAGFDVTTTWEGANHILIQQPAKFVLKGVQSLVKGQKVHFESLKELTLDYEKVNSEKVSGEEWRGNEKLMVEMAVHKFNKLVNSSILLLQNNVGKCKDMIDAWNQTQVHHLFDAAVAYGELYYLKLLLRKHAELLAICPKTASLFLRICELYFYTKVEKDLSLFRDNDYFSSAQALALKRYIILLCDELGESSVRIIDAIALPDHILGSPLGHSDGQVYRRFTESVEGGKGVYAGPDWFELLKTMRGPESKL